MTPELAGTIAKCLTAGTRDAIAVALCYGLITHVVRLIRERAGRQPPRRHLTVVIACTLCVSTAATGLLGSRAQHFLSTLSFCCLVIAAALVGPALLCRVAWLRERLTAPSRWTPAWLSWRAVVAIALLVALGVAGWSIRGLAIQRRIDQEIASVDRDARRYDVLIGLHDELVTRKAHVHSEIARMTAIDEGREPPPPEQPEFRFRTAPLSPPTWDPVAQAGAIAERQSELAVRRNRLRALAHLDSRRDEIRALIADLESQEADLAEAWLLLPKHLEEKRRKQAMKAMVP